MIIFEQENPGAGTWPDPQKEEGGGGSQPVAILPLLFRAVPVTERLPKWGEWVTTIDTAMQHRVYQLTEYGWNMREPDGDQSPNNNLAITHWLELVS